MTWSIQTVVSLGAVAKILIAITVNNRFGAWG